MMESNAHSSIAKAPFRLDLVMGGVSDLDFWRERLGDCLSISCDFSELSLVVNAIRISTPNIELYGFGTDDESFSIPMDALHITHLKECPLKFRLVTSAVIIGTEIVRKHINSAYEGGLIISNKSAKAKGMGGSSAIAACIVSLICQMMGGIRLSFNELVEAVIRTEDCAGIGGGWEDVAGIYNSGINRVRYRPNSAPSLSLSNLPCEENFVYSLERNLLVVDSKIKASTATILTSAETVFAKNPQLVIECSEKMQDECEIVTSALFNRNLEAIGESLKRQRKYWSLITGGVSASLGVERIIATVASDIIGFREAGAGGGGMVLVMCKLGKAESVASKLVDQGWDVRSWNISSYGLTVEI